MWQAMRQAERRLVAGVALTLLVAAALPALAQDRPESILPPGFDKPAPPAPPAPDVAPTTPAAPDTSPVDSAIVASNSLTPAELGPVAPPSPPPAE